LPARLTHTREALHSVGSGAVEDPADNQRAQAYLPRSRPAWSKRAPFCQRDGLPQLQDERHQKRRNFSLYQALTTLTAGRTMPAGRGGAARRKET
jgi:hypothetical protein